jgi:hypothetical protein
MWVRLGASARPPSRFSNKGNLDPRQKQAQQARIKRQKMEWKSWEESMEKKEEMYRSRKASSESRKERYLPEATKIKDGGGRKGNITNSRRVGSYRNQAPIQKKRDESDLMGTLYTRQRLYQKVNSFSKVLGEIQQGREEQLNQPEASLDNAIESPMIDQTSIRVLEEESWDW